MEVCILGVYKKEYGVKSEKRNVEIACSATKEWHPTNIKEVKSFLAIRQILDTEVQTG
jgi:hypothetical protein